MKLCVLFLLLLTSGCVTYGKRYLEVSPRYATLNKDFFPRSTVADSTFTYHNYAVTDSDFKGTGFQASFVEVERKYLYSRLGFHYVNLKTDKNFLFKDFISSIGGGLAIDIPLTKWLSLFVNGRWMTNSQTYSVGFLIGGWDFGDQKEYERQTKSNRKQ
jgi:hypothetical protein